MSSLQSVIRHAIGWYYSLGRKFFHVTPAAMIMGQTASLLSQTLLVSALILPIKILVLIGTDNIPSYYPAYLQSLEKTHLIVALSLLALACYCLYAVSEIVIHTCSISGAKKLIEESSKLKLFENQQQFSVKVYSRFVRGLAAGLFFIIMNVVLIFIYPLLFIVAIIYITIMVSMVVLLHNKKETIKRAFMSHKSTLINLLSSMGFLVLFFFMMVDYIYSSAPQMFTAVISLLLVRQGFSRLAVMIQDIVELRHQHRKIDALFFHDQQWVVESTTDTQLLNTLFSESRRHQWMVEALSSIGLTSEGIVSSRWHQLGRADIYAYEAVLTSAEMGHPTSVLFKVFGSKSSSMAQQESVLLDNVPAIPAPGFLGAANVEQLTCHIFDLKNHRKLRPGEVAPGVVDINRQLLSIEPPDTLIEQFRRSHLFLEQRLSPDILDQLTLVVSGTECLLLERFGQAYEGIKRILAQLPRQIVAMDTSADTLLLSDTDGICVSHWANWRMEPVGAGWAVGERVKLEDAVTCAQEARPSLLNVAAASIVLCAVVYAFERLCQRTHYRNALALVPQILDLYESIGPLPSFPQEDTSCHA